MELEVPCRIHKSPLPIPVLSQINPIHTLTPYFFNINFYIILSSTSRSYKWYFLKFSDQNFVRISHAEDECYVIIWKL
jgi:hypothetical protein